MLGPNPFDHLNRSKKDSESCLKNRPKKCVLSNATDNFWATSNFFIASERSNHDASHGVCFYQIRNAVSKSASKVPAQDSV